MTWCRLVQLLTGPTKTEFGFTALPALPPFPLKTAVQMATNGAVSQAVAFQSPKYIQQAGALQRVGQFALQTFPHAAAQTPGILTSARLRARYGESLCQSFSQSPVIAEFSGECSRSNLHSILAKLQNQLQGQSLGYIVGLGGGKLLDMAKLVR